MKEGKLKNAGAHLRSLYKAVLQKQRSNSVEGLYTLIAYAGLAAHRGNHEAASLAVDSWIRKAEQQEAQRTFDVENRPSNWDLLRARYSLATFLEMWLREQGDNASHALRLYHIGNLDKTISLYNKFSTKLDEIAKANGSYAIHYAGQILPIYREGVCRSKSDHATRAHESDLWISYVSLVTKYVDQALRSPEYRLKNARHITGTITKLAGLGLSCVTKKDGDAEDIRAHMRAEILALHALNDLNMAEIASSFADPAKSREQLQRAEEVARSALEMIAGEHEKDQERRRDPQVPFLEIVRDTNINETYEGISVIRKKIQQALKDLTP